MTRTRRTILAGFAAALAACAAPSRTIVDAAHNSRNSLDWAGTYSGTLPCADCAGIATRITLTSEETYELSETYLGESDRAFVERGRFSWDAAGRVIALPTSTGNRRYLVGEGRLIQRDRRGERIEGALAARYELAMEPPPAPSSGGGAQP